MRNIIVGVDGSTASERALDRAFLEAEKTGQAVRVVSAWTNPALGMGLAYGAPMPSNAERQTASQDLLEEHIAKAHSRRDASTPIEVTSEVIEGDPARTLTRLSRQAGTVIIGADGHGQLTSGLLGSVTTYVIHHSACPVIVVPRDAPVGEPTRVVVALDGSDSSRIAFQWALREATIWERPLIAVHAWRIHTPRVPLPYASLPTGSSYEQEARDWLDDEVAECLAADRTAVVRETRYGDPAGVLLDATGPDDLLVLGSRGRGGFASLVLGSVATQCATHARGSVVIVKDVPSS